MKKIYLVLFAVVCSFTAMAQTESRTQFEITPTDGFIPSLEVQVPGKSAEELFKLTRSWVFEKGNINLTKQIEGLKLTFEGTAPGLVSVGGLGKTTFDGRYTIEMIFGEGKYTFFVFTVEYYNKAAGKWMDAALHKSKEFFNKKGELKSMYKYYPEIPEFFNALNSELQAYIRNK